MFAMSGKSKEEGGFETGTSIFDPVLTELSYSWFCPVNGLVLDPYAGGSVRGIVASKLGLRYVGVDLSERQLEANRKQATRLCSSDNLPDWRLGDSRYITEVVGDVEADLIFSCPPYGSLERYSDDPRDLSTMSYEDFLRGLRRSVIGSLSRLKENRFAIFVVGDFRDKDGFLQHFPQRVARMFEAAGARLYNEAFLVTAVGSLPIRTKRTFDASRKLGRSHQNWLCFVKGDPKLAAEACGDITKRADINYDVDASLFGKGLIEGTTWASRNQGNLSDWFRIPPFTVLNAREGWWQSRKRAWIALGIQSELGRGEALTSNVKAASDGQKRYRDAAAPGGPCRR